MADEENEELTSLTPMERARKVAGDIYSRIPEAMSQYENPMASQSPISKSYSPEVTQFVEDMLPGSMAEAREFLESPGVGTGAMAAMGLTGFPAREMKGLAKLTKEQLTRLEPALRERHLYDQILDELNDLKRTIFHADHNILRMDYGMPRLMRGERRGKGGQLGGNLRANPDHPIVQRYYEVKDQLSKQGKKYRETPGHDELEGASMNMSAEDYRHMMDGPPGE